MNILEHIDQLKLILNDPNADANTPVAVVYLNPAEAMHTMPDERNPIYKMATGVQLKKVRLLGKDVDTYAIVLT